MQLLRGGRKISISYRTVKLHGLEAENLYEESELRLSAAIKSAGIAQKMLVPLEAEAMLGVTDAEAPWAGMLPLADELVEQATPHHTKPQNMFHVVFVFWCGGCVVKGVGDVVG